MTIDQIQNEIISEFDMFNDWTEKYEYIIDLGKSLPVINDAFKTSDNTVKGCQSKVWLYAEYINNKLIFTADSDAIMTKGIIAILIRVLSNQNPDEIAKTNLVFIITTY